jgi:hypothetical protein
MDKSLVEAAVRRLLNDLDGLRGLRRPAIPDGVSVREIDTTATPNLFAPDELEEYETVVSLSAETRWEPQPTMGLTRASDVPATSELEGLRELIAVLVGSSTYPELRHGELVGWSAQLPEGPRPRRHAVWSIRATIQSS